MNERCPYCNHEICDSWLEEDWDGNDFDFECPECEKKLSASGDYEVIWTVRPHPDHCDHVMHETKGVKFCIRCGKTEYPDLLDCRGIDQ